MDYQILVTLTFAEPGGKEFAMNSVVLNFDARHVADEAFTMISSNYPKNAVHATAVKLYKRGD